MAGSVSAARGTSTFTDASVGYHPNGNASLVGYLSDVYFVAGGILEPSAFATDDSGTWKPLPAADISAAAPIQPQQEAPYESRANTDQVWSSQVVPTNANTAKAFNGQVTELPTQTLFGLPIFQVWKHLRSLLKQAV